MKRYVFWFAAGSQHLYGDEVLTTVERRAAEMASYFNELAPYSVVYKTTVKTPEEAANLLRDANHDPDCAGVILWMHTFSPSKMWIAGLAGLQKPYCHLHTQYNRNIPDADIDMDFMNLNQSAHGDREHGFIGARLRVARKIVVGYWRDQAVADNISGWMRSAVGAVFSRSLNVVRFGDNMRQVAVTEGDKVEAQIKLGWQVNTWPVGYLAEAINAVNDTEVEALLSEYRNHYTINTSDLESVRYQAREELAMEHILRETNADAFTNTFEDLYGMEQLPGLATQRLMSKGYGYGGEGDWKTAALMAVVKAMTTGLSGGTSFMEDYTYDLTPGNELSLGAHMLEVCPSIASDKARIEVHPLGIGGRKPPARLVFESRAGSAVLAALVDMGGRFRLIIQDVEAVKPIYAMPKLPVARVMWKALPDFETAAHCWLLAGGSHHTVMSYDATAEMLMDWAEIMGIESVHITKGTEPTVFKRELFLSDLAWKLC